MIPVRTILMTGLSALAAFSMPARADVAGAPNSPEPPALGVAQLKPLLPELRRGGYILYFRHSITDTRQEDRPDLRIEDCATQRNLSADGQAQATRIGRSIAALGIPVGPVYASPFCRTIETARLAFRAPMLRNELYFAIGLRKSERAAKGAELRSMLGTPPPAGANTVIVAHTANLEEAVGYWPKPEGVAYLFHPQAAGRFLPVGKVEPDTWAQLAAPR